MSSKLEKKLSQNLQRRRIRELYEELDRDLQLCLSYSEIIYKEDVFSKHELPLFPEGSGGKLKYPEGYSLYKYTEVDLVEDLVTTISKNRYVSDMESFISIDSESAFFRVKPSCINCFVGWYLQDLKKEYRELVIFQSDFGKGVVVDQYCGYLPKPKSPNEIVYEYVYWEK